MYKVNIEKIKQEAKENAEYIENIAQELYHKPFLKLNKKELESISYQFLHKVLPLNYLKQSSLTLMQIAKDMDGRYEVFSEKNGPYLTNAKIILIDDKVVPQLRNKYWESYKEKKLKQYIKKEGLPKEMLVKEVETEIKHRRYSTKKIPPYEKVMIDIDTVVKHYTKLMSLETGMYADIKTALYLYTDTHYIYAIQKKYIDFFKKHLRKDFIIYKPPKEDKPFVIVVGRKIKGFVMQWQFNTQEEFYIESFIEYEK